MSWYRTHLSNSRGFTLLLRHSFKGFLVDTPLHSWHDTLLGHSWAPKHQKRRPPKHAHTTTNPQPPKRHHGKEKTKHHHRKHNHRNPRDEKTPSLKHLQNNTAEKTPERSPQNTTTSPPPSAKHLRQNTEASLRAALFAESDFDTWHWTERISHACLDSIEESKTTNKTRLNCCTCHRPCNMELQDLANPMRLPHKAHMDTL